MKFTYSGYENLIKTLKKNGYNFCNYHNYGNHDRECILRHDIDYSLDKSVDFAEFEKDIGVSSTYFVLFTSDFYNVSSKKSIEKISRIKVLGHEIGLHFDETVYGTMDKKCLIEAVLKEKNLFEKITGQKIKTVSMHRPSKWILETDLKIPDMVNSYAKEFFNEFKYVSDSRMNWREDVMKYAEEASFSKLHILTHPFWYFDKDMSMHDVLDLFLASARKERYDILKENFTDLESVIKR